MCKKLFSRNEQIFASWRVIPFFEISLTFLSRLAESANSDHRSPSKTTFQLNSGTKSDKEKSEGKDEDPRRVCSWGLPAESSKPRRSEPCRGIKALRAAITLTTRREVPRTGSIFGDFFRGIAIGDARRQNFVHFVQKTRRKHIMC